MIDQSPDALASLPAMNGGQLPVHGPLHALLPPASLSKVYSVIPASLVIVPPVFFAGVCASAVPANASPTIKTAMPLRIIILVSLVDRSNAGSWRRCKHPSAEFYSAQRRDSSSCRRSRPPADALDREHQAGAQPFHREDQLVHLV